MKGNYSSTNTAAINGRIMLVDDEPDINAALSVVLKQSVVVGRLLFDLRNVT
jgi:response regulator RpfG family c-di-GMP phosphodiesterase